MENLAEWILFIGIGVPIIIFFWVGVVVFCLHMWNEYIEDILCEMRRRRRDN